VKNVTTLGALIGIGILGALLTAIAVWLLGGPFWAIALGYIIGGMIFTILAGLCVARSRKPPDE